MELDAGGLSLPEPRLVVGVEYPVTQKITNRVAEVMSFREVGELGLEKMLKVTRIGGDNTIEAAKPGTFESKRSVLVYNDVGHPFVHVALETGDERR